MLRIIFATKNEHKLKEIREIFSELPYKVVSIAEAGVDIDVVEDGKTFAANSRKKAMEISVHFPEDIVMADDSGIEIDFLGGEPGVYSSRYLGVDTPYAEKNAIILDRLKDAGSGERGARFKCCVTAVFPDKSVLQYEGVMEGEIAKEVSGVGGFGYDPIFFIPEKGCTSAELSPSEKNAISHRGKALRGMFSLLKEKLG